MKNTRPTPTVKDPERVRLGRLGALTVHSRGRTNTATARAAWEAKVAAEAGITDETPADERERRMGHALRLRMLRLNEARWGKTRRNTTDKQAA